jgi:hypothetical protein
MKSHWVATIPSCYFLSLSEYTNHFQQEDDLFILLDSGGLVNATMEVGNI